MPKLKSELKIITIDFWNTLFDSQDGIIRNDARLKVLFDTLKDIGVDFDTHKINKVIKHSWEYYSKIWETDFRTPAAKEIINYIWLKMGFAKNIAAVNYLVDFFEKSILYFPPSLLTGAKEVLEKLNKNYQLAIISDTGFSPGIIMREVMQIENILKYFSAFSFSDETGVAKPHPKAFNTILNKFECNPNAALHIGDIERTDIEGAIGVGMRAIRFDGDPTSPLTKEKSNSNKLEDNNSNNKSNSNNNSENNNKNTSKAEFVAQNWQEILEYINSNT